jgi:hypothetical protein
MELILTFIQNPTIFPCKLQGRLVFSLDLHVHVYKQMHMAKEAGKEVQVSGQIRILSANLLS